MRTYTQRPSLNWPESKKQAVWNKSNGRCWYCGIQTIRKPPVTHSSVECCLDHLVPWFEGGTNQVSNLVPACRSCNAGKRQLNTEGYRLLVARKGIPHFTPAHLAYLHHLGIVLPETFPCYPQVTFWFEVHGLQP